MTETIKSIEKVVIPGLQEVTGIAALVKGDRELRVLIFGALKDGYNPDVGALVGRDLPSAEGDLFDSLQSITPEQLRTMYRKMFEKYKTELIRHLGLRDADILNKQTGERYIPEHVIIEWACI